MDRRLHETTGVEIDIAQIDWEEVTWTEEQGPALAAQISNASPEILVKRPQFAQDRQLERGDVAYGTDGTPEPAAAMPIPAGASRLVRPL